MTTPFFLVLGHQDDIDGGNPVVLAASTDRVKAMTAFDEQLTSTGHKVVELVTVTESFRQFTGPKKKEKPAPVPAPEK